MPRKKKNWELEYFGIHNPPESFYFKFGKTTLISQQLFQTPTVTTNRVLHLEVIQKVYEWELANKIPKEKALDWVELVKPIIDLLSIPKETRKELFQQYKETQQVKLETAIKAIEKAEKNLFNDEIRLFHLVESLKAYKSIYQFALEHFNKRETGEHQLLYDLILPLVDKMKEINFSEYKIKNAIDDLMHVFDYDSKSVGQSVLKYRKKPYFPKRLLKTIEEADKHPFLPIYNILNTHLKSK